MKMVYLYAVSSLREYEGGEEYFGTDGVFPSAEEARNYILKDIDDTIVSNGYDREDVSIDDDDYKMEVGNDCFEWKIDVLYVDLDNLIERGKLE